MPRTKQQGNGAGTVYPRKNRVGKISGYRGSYFAPDGRRRYISAKTKTEAQKLLRQAMSDADRGLLFEAGTVTVSEYLDRWLVDTRDTVRRNTWDRYEGIVRLHLKPSVGKVKLKALSPAHVRGLYRAKLDGDPENGIKPLSPRSVQYIHVTLHKALKQAVMDGLVPRNVTEAVKAPRPDSKEVCPLDRSGVHTLLKAARGDRLEALYVLAVTSGMRQGEILGLKWEDLNLDTGMLSVRRSLSITKVGPVLDAPKNPKSRRNIKLTSDTVEALRRHRTRQNEERLRLGTLWEDSGLVFPGLQGQSMKPWTLLGGSFKRILKAAGLPTQTRFHDLRHTCATLLLLQGVHPKFVQELLGHATISITLDTYSHVLPSMGDQAMKAMEKALS